MDWKRVEIVLIIALVITNILLLTAVSKSRELSDSVVLDSVQRENIVKELLSENNIVVNVDVEDITQKVPNMYLTYETYEDEGFIKLLLGDGYQKVDDEYISNEAIISVVNEQNLIYKKKTAVDIDFKQYDGTMLDNRSVASQHARKIADKFMENKGIKNSSAKFWKTVQYTPEVYCVKYRQYENDYFLEDAHMDIVVTGDEVIQIDKKWFGTIGISDVNMDIESPIRMLFRFINSMDTMEVPMEIISLELGYKLVSDIVPMRFLEGDSTPYWRIETDTGEAIYIKAKEVIH